MASVVQSVRPDITRNSETNLIMQKVTSPLYASASGLTGWAAMAKTVRDFDEEKIRDCKEDIDTLLVFVSPSLQYVNGVAF